MENRDIIQNVIQEMKENYEKLAEIYEKAQISTGGYDRTKMPKEEVKQREDYYKNLPNALKNNKEITIAAINCYSQNYSHVN